MKTALVTGGASGIGRAIADRLRSDGHQVAIIDLSPTDDTNSYVADVTDRGAGAMRRWPRYTTRSGPVTVLVNAAGLNGSSDSPTCPSKTGPGSSTSTSTACSTPSRRCCPTWSTPGGAAS